MKLILFFSSFRFFKQYLAYFCIHNMALPLYRFIAAVGRTEVITNALGTLALLIIFSLGGFIIAKGKLIGFFSMLLIVARIGILNKKSETFNRNYFLFSSSSHLCFWLQMTLSHS